jgi:hypothetical protein
MFKEMKPPLHIGSKRKVPQTQSETGQAQIATYADQEAIDSSLELESETAAIRCIAFVFK